MPPLSRARRRVFIVVILVLPFLLLLVLEGGLRIAGFGESYPLFVRVESAPGYLRVNPDIVRRFMADERKTPDLWIRPVYFPREKTPETLRIFVQGGSTAEGYPYGYGASPAGMLQQRLQCTFPERKVEVITTAMCAVNTYTLLDFTAEIIDQKPDAVLIYAGHNEYVGLLGVGSGFSVGLRRTAVLSFLWLRDLRIFQLLQGLATASRPEPEDRSNRTLMATIVREKKIPIGSSLHQRGLDQYRANLRAILARYRKAGIPVFIGTVVSNERDQPPFISGHGEGIDTAAWSRHFDAGNRALETGDALGALRNFDAAVDIDDAHAEGHFLRGRALDRLGRYHEARAAYLAAKDRDELRFRAPEAVNDILREVAAAQGATVVEVQEAFVHAARNGIVGQDLMLEHLHPNLRGYFLMADAFYEGLRSEGLLGGWEGWISPGQAWEEIPVTEVDRLYGEYRIRYLTSDWPFTKRKEPFRIGPAADRVERIAQEYYRGSHEWPDAMRKLLEHYRTTDDLAEAARVAVLLAEAFPHEAERQLVAAELLHQTGRPEGRVYFGRALRMAGPEQEARLLALQADLRQVGVGESEARPEY